MTEEKKSVYETLSKIDVAPKLEKKGKLDYLSWAMAWGMVKQAYPDANYKITEFPEYIQTKAGWVATGRDVDYRQTSAGTEVEAVVKIDGQEYSSKLFVMDFKNKPILNPNYFDINKTQQRALVKALAIAGLGLSVYAGEDLPVADSEKPAKSKQTATAQPAQAVNNLRNYQVNYKGQMVPMYIVVKHASEGNQEAKDFANTLQGKDMEVFKQLAKEGITS
ncbi:DUF1071 domain-containing protein [Lactobacillus apis]|uniref:Sak single strand annealing protein n=1 Tax=Lactobacillus apis TaxID=303541 RepID=UPI00242F6883|nr:DUF1071 domain-containing protein [Lactobacillus apis]